MENKADQLEARVLKLGYENFYKKGFKRPTDLLPSHQFLEKYIDALENTQKYETGYFWTDVCQGNLLTYLYTITDTETAERLRKAEVLNEACLKQEPSSLIALSNKIVIKIRRKDFTDTEKIFSRIEELSSCRLLCNIARSEIAFTQYYLSPKHYVKAAENYIAVIFSPLCSEQHQYCKELNVHKKITIWKYYRSHTHSRLLNKGNLESLLEKTANLRDTTLDTVAMLKEVINSDLEHFIGKACIALCDTYKKYETCGVKEAYPLNCDSMTVDEWAAKAYALSPDDGAVLQYYGRHLEQRATGRDELLKAVDILSHAVKRCPSRHIAHHHLAHCYKRLWLESDGHEERKLFNNNQRNQRNSRTSREQKQRKSWRESTLNRQNEGLPINGEVLNKNQEDRKRSWIRSTTSRPNSLCNSRDNNVNEVEARERSAEGNRNTNSVEVGMHDDDEVFNKNQETVKLAESFSHGVISPSRADQPTYYPEKLTSRGNPAHQRKKSPGYFDKLRVSNPKLKSNNSYFHKAIKHLELASEISKKTSCRYLVDLARLYISGGRGSDADNCFLEADRLSQSTDYNDLAYLYEQWALHRDPHENHEAPINSKYCSRAKMNNRGSSSQVVQGRSRRDGLDPVAPKRDTLDPKRENALELYRLAVIYAIRGRVRSRVAYYILCQYLECKKKKYPDDEIINLEYALLFQTMDQYDWSIGKLSEYLRKNPKDTENLWRLVEILFRRGDETKRRLAFRYLTLLADTKEMPNFSNTHPDQTSRSQLVLNIFGEVCLKEKSAAKTVFDWFAQKTAVQAGFRNNPDPTSVESFDITLMSSPDSRGIGGDESLTSRLIDLLQDECQLKLAHCFSVLGNEWILKGFADRVATSRAVIVIVDKAVEEWPYFSVILENLPRQSFPICLLTSEANQDDVSKDVLLSRLPCLTLNSEHGRDMMLLSEIFKTLFGSCKKRI